MMEKFEINLKALIKMKRMDIETIKHFKEKIKDDPTLSKLTNRYNGKLDELKNSLEELETLLNEFRQIKE